jgi:hypothetical protein
MSRLRLVLLLFLSCITPAAWAEWERYPAHIEIETFSGKETLKNPMVPWPTFIKEMDFFGFNMRDHVFQYVFSTPEQSSRYCFVGQEQAIPRYREVGIRMAPICTSSSGMITTYYWLEADVSLDEFYKRHVTLIKANATKIVKDDTLTVADPQIVDNVLRLAYGAPAMKSNGLLQFYFMENAKTRRLNMKIGVAVSNIYNTAKRPDAESRELTIGRVAQYRARMKVHTTVGTVPETPLTLE